MDYSGSYKTKDKFKDFEKHNRKKIAELTLQQLLEDCDYIIDPIGENIEDIDENDIIVKY